MQTLVSTVRAAGVKNVIMLGGLAYSNDLTEWLKYEPKVPDHNLVASWHSYNFNTCDTQSCWNSQVAPVLKKVPLIAGEIGENDCADDYIDPLMKWLDARSGSYLAWAWNADFTCGEGPGLIADHYEKNYFENYYKITPSNYGKGYRAHLLSLK
jgi:endoglucanase